MVRGSPLPSLLWVKLSSMAWGHAPPDWCWFLSATQGVLLEPLFMLLELHVDMSPTPRLWATGVRADAAAPGEAGAGCPVLWSALLRAVLRGCPASLSLSSTFLPCVRSPLSFCSHGCTDTQGFKGTSMSPSRGGNMVCRLVTLVFSSVSLLGPQRFPLLS